MMRNRCAVGGVFTDLGEVGDKQKLSVVGLFEKKTKQEINDELYHGDSIDQVEVNKQTHKISEL